MKRTIYSNYDLYDNFNEVKQFLIEEYPELCTVEVEDREGNISYEPSDNAIWDQIYFDDECYWDDTFAELKDFFGNRNLIMFGSVGRWNGSYDGAEVGTFEDLFYDIIKDCDYIEFTDDNGHFLLRCSHHDGNNYVEFKELNNKGYELYDNWEYGYGNGKTVNYGNEQLFSLLINNNFYSSLPHYCKKVWGK